MYVLSPTFTWLFDGVGGAIVVGTVGWALNKVFGSKEKSDAVALAEAEPPAPQPAAAPQAERSRANLKIVSCRQILVHTGLDGAFYQSEPARAHGEAVVVNVTNDARQAEPNVGAIIKATLIYEDAGQELLRGMGCWLSSGSGMVQFRVDDSHTVVLGAVINGEFSVPTKRRIAHGIGDVSFPTDRNLLKSDHAAVTVRLTDANSGDLYCEERFEIATNPLRISAARQAA